MDRHRHKRRPAALITGSTSGIGAAFAHLFAEKGKALVLVSESATRLNRQQKEIEACYPVPILPIIRDLSDPWAPEEVVEEIQRRRWHIEILVNSTGFNECGDFTETNLGHELQMIQAHIGATTCLTKRLLPAMIERGAGKILNVGAINSLAPCPGNAVYCATKAYILSFSEALASELNGTGVTVTTLLPGTKRTYPVGTNHVAKIGYRGLLQGRRRVVPGFHNRLMMMAAPFAPRFVNKWMTGEIGCGIARRAHSVVS